MKRRIIGGILTLIITGGVLLYAEINKPQKTEVIGVVTGKKLEEATTQSVKKKTKYDGEKAYKTKKNKAKYYVDIVYEDLKVKTDDKALYNMVEVGEEVKVMLNEYYDKKGNFLRKNITYED